MHENEIIIREIVNMLGLEILTDGKIYDVDKFTHLIYNGGGLYTNISGTHISPLVHRRDSLFDPINDGRLSKYLLQVLLSKEQEDNDLYVITQCSNTIPVANIPKIYKFRGELTTNNGDFKSDYYYRDSLQYIDLMYKLTGTPMTVNLHSVDYTEEQMEEIVRKRK